MKQNQDNCLVTAAAGDAAEEIEVQEPTRIMENDEEFTASQTNATAVNSSAHHPRNMDFPMDSEAEEVMEVTTTADEEDSDSSVMTAGQSGLYDNCARGPHCLLVTSGVASSSTCRKVTSCVDCGACAYCCNCQDGMEVIAASPTASPTPHGGGGFLSAGGRVYSIRLGASTSKMVDEMLSNDNNVDSEKTPRPNAALTVPISEVSGALSYRDEMSSRGGSDCGSGGVKKLTYDKEETDGDEPFVGHHHGGNGCGARWARAIHKVHQLNNKTLKWAVHYAATYPKLTIAAVCFTSVFMLAVGLATNFKIEVDNSYLWPPKNSLVMEHTEWYYYQSEFNYDTSFFDLIIHSNGENVLGVEGVRRTFEAIQAVRDLDGYEEGCMWAKMFGDEYFIGECKIHSVADFWNESLAIFEKQVETDDDVKAALSAKYYPNGILVHEPRVLGHAERVSQDNAGVDDDGVTTQLASAQSYLIEFDLPWTNVTEDFEWTAMERIRQLQEEWDADPTNPFRIEMTAYRSFSDEFFRSIVKDMPLLPAVFTIMSLFCCFVFWKKNRVESRCSVGIGAVVCILLSIFTGYGLLFCFGVSFTPVTTMMPFLMFGVGLDDSFIIYGSYNRIDKRIPCYERLMMTMDDVGLSISLTTLTSAVAFFMGVFSSIPAVSWVCWYGT